MGFLWTYCLKVFANYHLSRIQNSREITRGPFSFVDFAVFPLSPSGLLVSGLHKLSQHMSMFVLSHLRPQICPKCQQNWPTDADRWGGEGRGGRGRGEDWRTCLCQPQACPVSCHFHLFSLDLSKLPGAPDTHWQRPQLLPVQLLLLNTHPTWEWTEPVACTQSVLALLQNMVKESQEKELLLFVKVYTF